MDGWWVWLAGEVRFLILGAFGTVEASMRVVCSHELLKACKDIWILFARVAT